MTHPVRISVTDDLRRSRLTVLFRIVLALPHFVWLALWGYAIALFVAFQWLWALFGARLEPDAHSVIARYLRYQTHVFAYFWVLANPWPRFRGEQGTYPVDLEVDGPDRQNRWTVAFRLVLAIPALIFGSVLSVVLYVVGILGWFAALAVGRMPQGLRDLGAYCLRYQMQAYAYLYLVTPRYPTLASGTPLLEESA